MIVGLGIDAVDISRAERMFADKPERMLERLFGDVERAYLATKPEPAQHMAVRLAAKEAAYKALSGNELARGIGWRDVEVVSRDDGSPELRFYGRAAERLRGTGRGDDPRVAHAQRGDGGRGGDPGTVGRLDSSTLDAAAKRLVPHGLHAFGESRYIHSAMRLGTRL